MKITVEELFEHSLVISVDERRVEIMRRAFEREKLPMPRVVDGFNFRGLAPSRQWPVMDKGRYLSVNCSASHAMCVRIAKAFGWPYVCIFEDDAWPKAGAREALERELSDVQACLALFLGYARLRNFKPTGLPAFWGCHAYVVFAAGYDAYIAAYAADLQDYAADRIFRYYAPLGKGTAFSKEVVFSQANFAGGGWRYLRRDIARMSSWDQEPDPGFPRAEDVLPPELIDPSSWGGAPLSLSVPEHQAPSRFSPFIRSGSVPPSPSPTAVDVLYVVGDGSKDIDDLPLRWSLRSLSKYAADIGRVIVAGKPPDWLSDEVVAIYVEDEPGLRKQTNIALCAIKAARAAKLVRPFLYSSDDHYLLPPKPTRIGFRKSEPRHDFARWPRYYTGEIPQTAIEYICDTGQNPGAYGASLIATRLFLHSQGLVASRRACLHLNTWWDPIDLDKAETLVRRGVKCSPLGLEPSCVFNALWETRRQRKNREKGFPVPLAVKPPDDCDGGYVNYPADRKIRTVEDIESKIERGLPGFSTTPASERDPDVMAWMNAYYSEPSPWEES